MLLGGGGGGGWGRGGGTPEAAGRGSGFEEAGITAGLANLRADDDGGKRAVLSEDIVVVEGPLKKSVMGINLDCAEGFCVADVFEEVFPCMIS
jgi:hypothetical protein